MAKYESIITIRGTIDDLTFRKTKEGKVVGAKTGPTREKVLTHENFARTRDNAREFKQAVKDATLLRRALGSLLDGVRCTTLNGDMHGLLSAVSRQDPISDLGSRCAAAGDVDVLTGFDFNRDLTLAATLPIKVEHNLDATTGQMKVQLPSFIAYKRRAFRKEATHFRIVSVGMTVNFDKQAYCSKTQTSDLLPLSRKTPGPICLEHSLNARPGDVLVQALAIQLYKLDKGKEVLVKGGAVQILEAVRMEIPEIRIESELHELEKGNEALRQQDNEEKGGKRPTYTEVSVGEEGNKEDVCFDSSTCPAPAGSLTLQELLDGQDAVVRFGMTRKDETPTYAVASSRKRGTSPGKFIDISACDAGDIAEKVGNGMISLAILSHNFCRD